MATTEPSPDRARRGAPALVVDSEQSDARLRAWASDVAAGLPHGHRRSMRGDWHQVPEADLAPALADFFAGRADLAGSAEPTGSGLVTRGGDPGRADLPGSARRTEGGQVTADTGR